MHIIGLTGSVATGKSAVGRMLEFGGYAVFDADGVVAELYRSRSFQKQILAYFPESMDSAGELNKQVLARVIFADHDRREQLEQIIHPLVRNRAQIFTDRYRRMRRTRVFWNVPLLWQSGMDAYCDQVWVTACPEHVQKTRVLQRQGWDNQRWLSVKAAQLSTQEQTARADCVLQTGLGKGFTWRALQRAVSRL